jgi:hypothetical protein
MAEIVVAAGECCGDCRARFVRAALRIFMRARPSSRFAVPMTPRYIAARRPDGCPSRHLTTRQLRRMRQRFRRVLALASMSLLLAACVLR